MLAVFDRELSCLYYWVVENLNDRQKFAVFLLSCKQKITIKIYHYAQYQTNSINYLAHIYKH